MGEVQTLSDAHVEGVCRLGQGAACCAFLMRQDGWFCAKIDAVLVSTITDRRPTMRAQGDNCSGPPNYEVRRG